MRFPLFGILVTLLSAGTTRAAAPPAAPVDFNRDVRPILSENCYACHGYDAKKRAAGLRLDVQEGAFGALPSGRRGVVPGDPKKSEALRRVLNHTMPPPATGKKLTDAQTATLRRWIEGGAKYAQHWSLIRPQRPPLPKVKNTKWSQNGVDAFILARLEREGLRPSPGADRTTLIRRLSLDLTGLPPTPAEVDAYLADTSPRAYETVVDRLLASPRYGERMAWEWLDAARYADTNGYQGDGTRTMWPWRDWVVQALNRNMPYDQFTVEQLAGDLLPHATVSQKLATGFNRNHMLNGEGGRIPEESRVDYVVDRVDTTSTVWLGMTVGCARCHDHKFDPFAQKEYYQFYSYFNNLPETGAVDRGGNANPVLPLPTPEQSGKIAGLKATVQAIEARVKALAAEAPERPAAQAELEAARKSLRDAENGVLVAMVMEERPQPRESFVLVRGAWDKPGEKVTPGVPASLPPLPAGAPANRLGLAKWLVDPAHPLTARVAVNRYWQLFFGTGLVKTTEDFGVQGERPSHPELLDWLATQFTGSGWNVKAMHKLLVMSAAYRQSSRVTPTLQERDPENRLLARGPRFRLSSAAIRDAALAISGLLVEKQGGPSVKPYQPAGVWEDATFGQIRYQQDSGESLYRRSVYTFWRRIVGPTMLFDTAARQNCSVRQARTNTPLQALTLLND
ncbi:MAG TPA: PSD1 and planctomycete cytochrome C domain-containing protein, partial [Armatimonadota bacterium]|nr:PSD1 and planctomycete cytochrome C domain-containing protein [Armatimonadota bacterium]